MKKTFKFVVSATMEWPESEMTEQRAHDYIMSAIRDCGLKTHIEDSICDCDTKVDEMDVEDADDNTNDRKLAMRQMEQELIGIVREHGDDILPLEDLGMSWTEECDGECYTKDITDISIEHTWDGDTVLNVCINGIDRIPYSDCDREDLGHNLADYIYEEIKANY